MELFSVMSLSGGGSGGGVHPAGTVSNITVGALPSGSDISGKSALEVQRNIVIQDLQPIVGILTIGGSTQSIYEKGISIANPAIKVQVTKTDSAIKNVKLFLNNVEEQSITSGVEAGGTFTFNLNKTITTDTNIKITADDQTNSGSATKALKFVDASYYGILATNTPTATDILNLTKKLNVNRNLTEYFTANKEYTCFCYPKSYGELTKITDVAGGYPLLETYKKIEITVNGVVMYCYVDIDKATVNNFKIAFE